ncbi:hypothetical protein HY218_01475 [Candidatus Saccharibacteria bacterium]|nr:hypothetical protein [Candidatus Saccharibacteria bacterium]
MAAKKPTGKKTSSPRNNRRLKQSHYRSFRLHGRIKAQRNTLPPAWRLWLRSVRHLIKNWRVFSGIVVVYAVLTLILVQGFGVSSTVVTTKQTLQAFFHSTSNLSTGVTLFGVLLGSNAAPSDAAAAYQSMLIIVTSLALVWALRQTYGGIKIRIRDAFYRGMSPLVPSLLVLLVIGLQLVPLIIANLLYNFVFNGGLAVTVIEKGLWGILLFLLALLSLYMITSSLFALYVVTLPDMTPVKALRSARELVRFRRWTTMRKILFLPLTLLVLAALIFIPLILYVTLVAQWLYFVATMVALALIHSFLYALYRELII